MSRSAGRREAGRGQNSSGRLLQLLNEGKNPKAPSHTQSNQLRTQHQYVPQERISHSCARAVDQRHPWLCHPPALSSRDTKQARRSTDHLAPSSHRLSKALSFLGDNKAYGPPRLSAAFWVSQAGSVRGLCGHQLVARMGTRLVAGRLSAPGNSFSPSRLKDSRRALLWVRQSSVRPPAQKPKRVVPVFSGTCWVCSAAL